MACVFIGVIVCFLSMFIIQILFSNFGAKFQNNNLIVLFLSFFIGIVFFQKSRNRYKAFVKDLDKICSLYHRQDIKSNKESIIFSPILDSRTSFNPLEAIFIGRGQPGEKFLGRDVKEKKYRPICLKWIDLKTMTIYHPATRDNTSHINKYIFTLKNEQKININRDLFTEKDEKTFIKLINSHSDCEIINDVHPMILKSRVFILLSTLILIFLYIFYMIKTHGVK